MLTYIVFHVQGVEYEETESVWSYTGGGFSSKYPAPDFQKDAIATYFDYVTKGLPANIPKPGYNATGRGFPDISFPSVGYRVQAGGVWQSLHNYVGGTSASCPVAGGFFSNVNAARLAAGKGSLGWVTPALYTYAPLFVNDITTGNNAQCSDKLGFYATTGWDPASGS